MGDFDDINVKINVDASGAEQGLTRVSTSLNKLNSDVGKLGTGADFGDKLNSEAKQAEGGLDKLGQAAEQANQKLAKIGSGLNLSAVGSQLDALSGKMQSWGAGLSILAAPFELVGAASVNAFADFEAGMGKIFTLLPDITEKGMSEMSAQIKEFSTTFGADLSTVQQAAYDALSSGVSQVDLMPFLETAQAAAVAGMSDVGTAVDGLTSAINAYQMELDDAGRVSDVFFKTVELGKIEFDELSRNIGKVAPTAAQFGISIEDTGAAIAAMTSQGVSAEETMTGLKNLFKDVATPGTQLNKIFQEIAGTTFKDFIANGGTLAEAVSKLRDYSQQTGKSFFEMGSTFESANALAMLGGGFFEKYAEMTEKVGSAAGSTESAYGKMSDTMAFALDKLKAQFQVMSVDIGEKLAPVVLEFTEWLTENADKISDFAQNVASAAVPAIESIFDTLQKGMDMYENMSPETKSMLAKLIGVGAVGAAVAGPGLLIGGTALSPVASLITMMGNLQTSSVMAKGAMGGVSTEAGIIAGSSGAVASGLGGISTALEGIGPLGWAAAAGLAAAGAAYVTNFGGFRDNINDAVKEAESAIKNFNTGNYEDAGRDAAEAMAKGLGSFGDLAVDAVKATPEALQAGSEFVEAFQDGVNQSADAFGNASAQMLLSAMESGIQTNASILSGAGAVITESIQNGINTDSIGSFLVSQLSGISLESVGGTLAQSLISGFTHANFGPMGDVVENALKGVGKGTIDWIQEETAKLVGATKEDVQKKASTLPFVGGILGGDYDKTVAATTYAPGISTGAAPGTMVIDVTGKLQQQLDKQQTSNADVISKLAEEKDVSYESAKKMYDSSEKFAASVDKMYGATTVAPTTTTPTGAQVLAPTTMAVAAAAPIVYERPSADIPDLFTKDPAKYVEKELKSILEGGFEGSIDAYESYLKEFGMTLEDKGKQIFEAAKSKGFGGGVDWDDWWSEAQAGLPISIASLQNSFKGLESVFQTLEKTISDGSASSSEAERYLDEYNKSTGKTTEYTQKQTSQTKDLMNAYSSISNAQDLYNKYMDDGKLSAEEATTVQAALAQGIDLMGTAGADTADKIANMPSALKDLASAVSDFLNNIKSSVNSALQDTLSAEGWKLDRTDKYETIGDSSKTDLGKYFGLDSAGNTIDQFSQSTRDLTGIYDKANESTTMLNSTIELTPSAIDILTESTSAMASTFVAKAQELNAAVVAANSRAQRSYDESNRAWNPFGSTPSGWRDPSPCGWGVAFETGGRVASTGMAMVHSNEWILNRNDVRNLNKQQGREIKLTVDMRNSRFGNADLAKDLPNKIARAMTRVKIAGGM